MIIGVTGAVLIPLYSFACFSSRPIIFSILPLPDKKTNHFPLRAAKNSNICNKFTFCCLYFYPLRFRVFVLFQLPSPIVIYGRVPRIARQTASCRKYYDSFREK